MDSTFPYKCWCCDGTVQVAFPGGFAGTTATITPCARQWEAGMRAFNVRRSAVLDMEPVTNAPIQHRDGLAVFG